MEPRTLCAHCTRLPTRGWTSTQTASPFAEKGIICPALDFVHGDAESLPFADQSFDAVINVEASHAYPRFPRFLAEVVRVLRPGGHFLYADFRGRSDFSAWEAALADTQMRQVSERVINAEVLRGLEKNSQRSLDLIDRLLPAFLRRFGRCFAGVPGTRLYRDITEREDLSTGCIASPRIERRPLTTELRSGPGSQGYPPKRRQAIA